MKSKNNPKNHKSRMHILMVAGETSGDYLGAEMIAEWNKKHKENPISFWGFGGTQMKKQGMEVLHTVEELHTIGILEALKNYRRLKRYMNELVKKAKEEKPKAAVLIDYPGFNLRLAKKLHKLGIPCYQVVSPQIWAWNYRRVKIMKKVLSGVFCLYPFEPDIYKKEGVPAYFVSHPLVKKTKTAMSKFRASKISAHRSNTVALLPGSRHSEIEKLLPFLLDIAADLKNDFPRIKILMPIPDTEIQEYVKSFSIPEYIKLMPGKVQEALYKSKAAVACSGTVTLEAALLETPFVLIYKTSATTYHIWKRIVKVKWIGLVNLLLGREVVKEFIQHEMRHESVYVELTRLLTDDAYYQEILSSFRELKKNLGDGAMAKHTVNILDDLIF
ncbi:MAG: lipid-A-disaccharide synthase [Candidatus Hydrogenedentota bacterium]|nr:MAG: lipid-A-disaccharide synthase [Candidatus Hydrogenedentota bacterium]